MKAHRSNCARTCSSLFLWPTPSTSSWQTRVAALARAPPEKLGLSVPPHRSHSFQDEGAVPTIDSGRSSVYAWISRDTSNRSRTPDTDGSDWDSSVKGALEAGGLARQCDSTSLLYGTQGLAFFANSLAGGFGEPLPKRGLSQLNINASVATVCGCTARPLVYASSALAPTSSRMTVGTAAVASPSLAHWLLLISRKVS
eukprot:scaffold3190_cov409-Prasinococcus_capsulatus_cf.AAC.6